MMPAWKTALAGCSGHYWTVRISLMTPSVSECIYSPLATSPLNICDSSFGATFIEMAYGLPNQEDKNKIVDEFEDALTSMSIMVSGTSLLEFLPVLGRVPTWLPGTSFLRLLEHYRKVMLTVRELPWAMVKSAVVSSVCLHLL